MSAIDSARLFVASIVPAATWTGEAGVLTVLVMWSLFALMHRARWAGTEARNDNA